MAIPVPPILIERLRKQQCVLFAGAGLSIPAKFPSWKALIEDLVARLPSGEKGETSELAKLIADGKLLTVADHCQERMGEARFREALAERIRSVQADPPPAHRVIARLPFSGIVTTNYDRLFERAFGDGLTVRTHEDRRGLSSLPFDPKPFLLKAHGDVAIPRSMILTERDYRALIHSNPEFKVAFSWIMFGNAILFAGYSLNDPDFRLWLDGHAEMFGAGAGRFALMCGLSRIERDEFHRNRGIEIISYPDGQHGEVDIFLESLESQLRPRAGGGEIPHLEIREVRAIESPPTEELREFLTMVEAAKAPERARLLARPSPQERAVLIDRFGHPAFVTMRSTALAATRQPSGQPRGRVVIIPDFMGSELSSVSGHGKTKMIWLSILRLALGALGDLRLDADGNKSAKNVRATGILKRIYASLAISLAAGWDVQLFFYDWRKSFRLAAADLRDNIAKWFPEGGPCHLVAHGAGGLVARTFVHDFPETWEAMWDRDSALPGRRGGRLVMLGTPHYGSLAVPQMISGTSETLKKLAAVDLKHDLAEVISIFNSFPSLYEMLPSPFALPAFELLYRPETYGTIAVSAKHLDAARELHRDLRKTIDPQRMTSVLSEKPSTWEDEPKSGRVRFHDAYQQALSAEPRAANQLAQLQSADGTPVPTYYSRVDHGELPQDPTTFAAMDELLETGVCEALPVEPAAR